METKLLCPDCCKKLKVVESGLSNQLITAICSRCRQSWYGFRENVEKLLETKIQETK